MKIKAKHIIVVLIAAALAACFIYGCTDNTPNTNDNPPLPITIMTSAAAGNSVTYDSPVKKKVEELTNTRLDIEFVPSASYPEKLNIALASGDMPTILYIDENTPNVVNAIRRGEFWDVTDYLAGFEHLSKANPIILNNMSVDGRVWGLYRKRTLGRFGYVYRKDWLEKLGLSEPETVDDFYEMLRAFTYDDPDGNGKNDTYGMTVTTSDITFNNFAVWNGAPNGWGFDGDKLIPAHLTDSYFDTVKLFRKMAQEGLINPDFVIMDASYWNEPFINGESGVIVDTCDRAVPLETGLLANNPDGKVGVAGIINYRVRPHLGYSGYFAFPKSEVKDEETLKRVLKFMDDCSEREIFDLMRYGIEGRHYDLVDGYIQQRTGANVPRAEINDFNQVLTFIDETEGARVVQTEMQKTVDAVQTNNEKYIITNPAEGLISETYMQKGAELDKIVTDARIKYMSGQLSDDEYKAEMQRWRDSGGDDVIREINEEYRKLNR